MRRFFFTFMALLSAVLVVIVAPNFGVALIGGIAFAFSGTIAVVMWGERP